MTCFTELNVNSKKASMTYTFSLDESDYLTHQLFFSSKSKQSLKTRRKSWLFTTGSFAVLAFALFYIGDAVLGTSFAIVSVISLLFFPFYIRWKYKKHFLNHIRENFSNNFGKKASIEFRDNHFLTYDENESESKISFNLIKSIHELPEYYFFRLDTGQTLIMPKQKITDLEAFQAELESLTESLGLQISDDTKWSWTKSW